MRSTLSLRQSVTPSTSHDRVMQSDKIILEISEEYGDWRRILGEHRWAEFLKNPTPEEARLRSQIFFCTADTPRKIQKKGWKRVDVEDEWFLQWKLYNRSFIL